jgi:hypothetical protein
VYGVDRTAREAVGGQDACDNVVAKQVRESALAADHTPVGAVRIEWEQHHPDETEAAAREGRDPRPHPRKDWARASVQVRPNTVRKDEIARRILDGELTFEVDPSSTG